MAEKLCELRKKGGGGGRYTETSLWQNSNPSVAFSAQTVTLSDSLSNYKYVAIHYKYAGTTDGVNDPMSVIVSVDKFKTSLKNGSTRHNIITLGVETNGNVGWTRNVFYASDTTIEFDTGYKQNAASSSGDICVPTQILGLNELDHGKRFDETVLWTNNSPSSSFAGQTISLSSDIDNFDYIKVNYRYSTSSTAEYSVLASVSELRTYSGNGTGRLTMSETTGGGYFAYRPVTYSSNTALAIGGCGYANSTTFTANNGLCVPTSIVGCKFR